MNQPKNTAYLCPLLFVLPGTLIHTGGVNGIDDGPTDTHCDNGGENGGGGGGSYVNPDWTWIAVKKSFDLTDLPQDGNAQQFEMY